MTNFTKTFVAPAGSHARIMELEDFCFSDFHKDVYGFRPRGETWDTFVNMEPEALVFCVDNMFRIMEENEKEQEELEAKALEDFKATLRRVMKSGAGDWKTALRWMIEESDENVMDYYLWNWGIGFAKRREIADLYYAEV